MRLSSLKLAVLGVTAAALGTTPTNAQTTSSTPVIGYYKFDVPQGNSLWVCGFITKTDFQAQASSMTAGASSQVNFAGTPFSPGAFSLHYIEVMSGAKKGLILDITGNTASQLTVLGDTTALGLSGTETIAIRKHATLGSVFAGGAGVEAGSDSVTIINSLGVRSTYSWNGGNWEDVATLDDGTSVILYPGQGVIITAAAARVVTFGGGEVSYVKPTETRIPLYANVPNLVGLINPLVATQPSDPIYNTSGVTLLGDFDFVASLTAGVQSVDVRPNTGSLASVGVFSSNGSNMEDVATLDDGTPLPVRNGSAIIVSSPSNIEWIAPSTIPSP